MSRLEKKCLVAAGSLHLLLLLVGSVASAYVRDQPVPPDPNEVITIVSLPPNRPLKPVDTPTVLVNPGGSSQGTPTPPETKPVEAVKPPPRAKPPEPQKEENDPKPAVAEVKPTVAPPKPSPREKTPTLDELEQLLAAEQQQTSFELPKAKPSTPKTPIKRSFNFDQVTARSVKEEAAAKKAAEAAERRKQQEEVERAAAKAYAQAVEQDQKWRREVAGQFSGTSSGIKRNTAGATSIEEGGFGGGEALANYTDLVYDAFQRAWRPPEKTESSATVTVRVLIERDGTVVSAVVQTKSGNTALDRSIEETLRRVPRVSPFPAAAKDKQRSFLIKFNLKTKQAIG